MTENGNEGEKVMNVYTTTKSINKMKTSQTRYEIVAAK